MFGAKYNFGATLLSPDFSYSNSTLVSATIYFNICNFDREM
jgi:hypothetical protein